MAGTLRIFSDIRFWIILFFVFRLYGITNAPVEATHSWRQCLTNMQARNFLEVDNNILYPRIDMNGEKPGIIAGEFPLFNYLIYLWSLVFGYTHWGGRLINLIVSSIGVWFYFKLIRDFFDKKIAFISSLVLLSSLWFSFSRKVMPDTFSISLVLISLYFGMKYLFENKFKHLIYYVIFAAAGSLSKIPAMALMSVFVIPLVSKEIKNLNKVYFCIASVFVLIPVAWWYLLWSKHLYETFGYQLYFYANGFSEAARQLFFEVADKTLAVFYFNSFCGYLASALFISSLFLVFKKRNKIIYLFLCVMPMLILFMLKTGEAFATHNYYVLPFLPFMALLGGYAVLHIKNQKLVYILLSFACIESVLNQQHDLRKKQNDNYKIKLEAIADSLVGKNDLVAINGEGSPQQMYFMHRRGWNLDEHQIVNRSTMDSLVSKGCKYLFINKRTFQSQLDYIGYKKIFMDEDYVVFNLIAE